MNKINIKSILSVTTHHQGLLLTELLNKGFKLDLLDKTDIIVAKKSGKPLFFIGEYTPLIPHSIGLILTSRRLVYSLMQSNGVNMDRPLVYTNLQAMISDANLLAYPVSLGLDNPQFALTGQRFVTPSSFVAGAKSFAKYKSPVVISEKSTWKYKLSIFVDVNGFVNVLGSILDHNNRKKLTIRVKDLTDIAHPSLHSLAKKVLSLFPSLEQLSFTVNINDPFDDISESYMIETIYPTVGAHYKFKAISSSEKKRVLDITVEHILRKHNL